MHDTLTPLPTALRRLRATDLPWATDWAAIFSTDLARPLILEIGFGYGQMLKHLAHTRPDANIIGVEISNESLLRAEAAIQHGKLPNVRVVYSRAETALYHLFAPDTLHAIHINFPDPWFKTSHTHRRLMQRATLDVMVSRMQVGAHLYLATDIAEYAVMSAKLLAETAGLTNLLDAPWVHTLPGRTVTKYEARALKEGRTCHYFAYERNGERALPIPVYQDAPMPHLIFTSPLTLEAMQSQFQASEHKIDRMNLRFIGVYSGLQSLLFDTFVDEPTIEQRVALLLTQREHQDGSDDSGWEYTVRLGVIGNPRPTEGIHIAVKLLSQWLLGLHPDTKMVAHKLQHWE